MMKFNYSKVASTLGLIGLVALSYPTYKLWKFAHASSDYFKYVGAAIDCFIQENGQNETDVDILFQGYKSRKAYADAVNKRYPGVYPKDSQLLNRKTYNSQIPECKKFYTQFQCWEMDPYDPKSLDGCGKKFGLTQEEIDIMKKDPSKIHEIMGGMYKKERDEK